MKQIIINPEKETEKILGFIREVMRKSGFKRLVVGVSGGVDSAVCLALCVKALGKENVIAVAMPYGDSKDRDGAGVIEKLAIPEENRKEIDITKIVNVFKIRNPKSEIRNNFQNSNFHLQRRIRLGRKISKQNKLDRIRMGNVMARVRMMVLYDLTKQMNALVCGTENKSEYLLGYYTRFGDEVSDLEPIRHLYKTQVYILAKYLGIPKEIINKKPTAGLWKGQTDCNELGFTYNEADEILYQAFNLNIPWQKIIPEAEQVRFRARNNKEYRIKKSTILKIKKRVEGNWFKKEVPYYIK